MTATNATKKIATDTATTTIATAPFRAFVENNQRASAGAFTQDQFDIDAPWHHHDMHQLQYAFEGSIEVEDKTRRHLLPRTLAAWIPAGVAHRTSIHRVRSGSIMFAPELVPNAGGCVRIVMVPPLMREMVIGAMRWQIDKPLDAAGDAYFKALALLCSANGLRIRSAALSLPSSDDPISARGDGSHPRAIGRGHHRLGERSGEYIRGARCVSVFKANIRVMGIERTISACRARLLAAARTTHAFARFDRPYCRCSISAA